MPGCRTLPATSTVTVPGAAPVDGPPAERRARRRPARPRARRRPAPAPGRGQRGSVVRRPRTSHQQVTASPTATTTATTASWAAPSPAGPREPRRACRPGAGGREAAAGVWAPAAAGPVVGAAPRAWCARPTTGRSSGRWWAAPAGPSARPETAKLVAELGQPAREGRVVLEGSSRAHGSNLGRSGTLRRGRRRACGQPGRPADPVDDCGVVRQRRWPRPTPAARARRRAVRPLAVPVGRSGTTSAIPRSCRRSRRDRAG